MEYKQILAGTAHEIEGKCGELGQLGFEVFAILPYFQGQYFVVGKKIAESN